jgi:hypothetical protein
MPVVRSAARVLALLSRPNGATIMAHGDAKPLSAAGYRAAMGVTQATFIDAVRQPILRPKLYLPYRELAGL